jgi:hypothetical protein
MKSIKVFIYSYKNKNLLEYLEDIINKQSNNFNVTYYVYDQNNVNRDFLFTKIKANLIYTHVRWDDLNSITYYRNMTILNYNFSDYYFEINSNISLMNNWDILLTSNIDNKKIISGFENVKLSIDRSYIVATKEKSYSIEKTNYIDFDLVFCLHIDAMILLQLNGLKETGQDLLASLLFVDKDYEIYSLPSEVYIKKIQENTNTYKSFSKNHGYNKMLLNIKNKNNQKFESFHGILIKDILEIPYQIDDVPYNNYKISLEHMDSPRFLKGYNRVEIT